MARIVYMYIAVVLMLSRCEESVNEDNVFYSQTYMEMYVHRLPDTHYAVDEWSGDSMVVLYYIYTDVYTDSIVWEEGHIRIDAQSAYGNEDDY